MNHHHSPTATAPPVRTPYHELGEPGSPHVPDWARRRSVYRGAGRTTYIVETDRLAAARHDLKRLQRRGWRVNVTELGKNAASVALSRDALRAGATARRR